MTIIVVLILLYYKWDAVGISKIINVATKDSQYIPTVYDIYDKSTLDMSNKLIFIRPFNWLLLNIENALYIIDQVGTGLCAVGTTTAYHVTKEYIYQICLSFDINSMINVYTSSGTHYRIPYEIDGTVFTAISAINELSKFCLQFDSTPKSISNIKITPQEFNFQFSKSVKSKSISPNKLKTLENIVKTHNSKKYQEELDRETIRHNKRLAYYNE